MKLPDLKRIDWNAENITLLVLSLSFFIGIWHGLPQLTVVADENYFVGGVLRAMENKSILPAPNDVPYGTLTYFLSYVLIAFYLISLMPLFGFSLTAMKEFLIQSPQYVYIIPRLLSAVLALVFLHFIYKLIKKEISDWRWRVVFLIVLFTNMLTVLILHTAKMWVLSTLLVVISFYFLYHALLADEFSGMKKNSFWSMVFGFLAAANFPLNLIFLVNVPILGVWFRHHKVMLKKLAVYTLIGMVIYFVITALNFTSIKNQVVSIFTDYNPLLDSSAADPASLAESLRAQIRKAFAFFPLIILLIVLGAKKGAQNKKLLALGCIYFLTYLLGLSLVANWATDLYKFTRYSFPLAFFLFFIALSFRYRFNRWFWVLPAVSVLYFLPTLYYLAAPTTYNLAESYVIKNLNADKTVVFNEVDILQLPKNKASYLMNQDYFCASKCQNVLAKDLNQDIKPIVIDQHTGRIADLPDDATFYYIKYAPPGGDGFELLADFSNNVGLHFGVEGRMANYYDLDIFRAKRFGTNIFIYEAI